MKNNSNSVIYEKLSDMLTYSLRIILNAIFLIVWVIVQYTLTLVLNYFVGDTQNETTIWLMRIFEIIFAISTLIPIIIYLYRDILLLLRKENSKQKDNPFAEDNPFQSESAKKINSVWGSVRKSKDKNSDENIWE